ncbi:MAG: DUF2987 domain-containing protein [Pseudomonadota bacterium]
MKKAVLFTMLALSSQLASAAEDRAWVPYRKLVDTVYLDKFSNVPPAQRDKVAMFLLVTPKNPAIKPGDVVITVAHKDGKLPFKVAPGGRLDIPYNAKWVADDARLLINQPPGEKMNVSFGLQALMPEGLEWKYASLMGSVAQSNALIKNAAGMLSMFAPKTTSVKLKFAKPAQLKLMAKGGATTLASDAKHRIELKPDEALMLENPMMVLSERPLGAELD